MDCSPPGSSLHGDSPGKNTGVGCHALLQGIFPTQGSNPGLLHWRRILYWLSQQGSPRILDWVAYPFCRGSSWPRNWTGVSWIAGRFFTSWATREASVLSLYLHLFWKATWPSIIWEFCHLHCHRKSNSGAASLMIIYFLQSFRWCELATSFTLYMWISWASLVTQLVKKTAIQETPVQFLGWGDPLRNTHTTKKD